MKKVIRVILYVLLSIFLLLGISLAVLSSSRVQTKLVGKITQELTEILQTPIEIEHVSYRFFNRVEVNGLYVEDLQGDTLLSIDTLQAQFKFWDMFQSRIIFNEVQLKHFTGKVYPTPSGDLNIAFLQNLFVQKDSAVIRPYVEVKNIHLSDGNVRLWDYHLSNFAADLALNCLSADSLDAEIEHLYFCEPSGFVLSDFQAHLLVNPEVARMPQLELRMPKSTFKVDDLRVRFADMSMAMNIRHARIAPSDLVILAPELKHVRDVVDLSCSLSGKLDALHLRNLAVDYGRHPILRANISAYGLPDPQKTEFIATIQDLQVNAVMAEDILSDLSHTHYQLPAPLAQLDTIHYRGRIHTHFDHVQLGGTFSSPLGKISTEGDLYARQHIIHFDGKLNSEQFALDELLQDTTLGDLAFETDVHFQIDSVQNFSADMCMHVPFFDFKGYRYRGGHIDGNLSQRDFKGVLTLHDPNAQVHFDGLIDFTKKLPHLDFQLQVPYIHFGKTNLLPAYADSDIRFGAQIKGVGNRLDNINGNITIDTLSFRNKTEVLQIPQLTVDARTNKGENTSLVVKSDFLNADIRGDYTYNTLYQTVLNLIAQYIPSSVNLYSHEKSSKAPTQNVIRYNATLTGMEKITQVLDLPITLRGNQTLKGYANEKENLLRLQLDIPEVQKGENVIENIHININNTSDQLNCDLSLFNHATSKPASQKLGDIDFHLAATARNDTLFLDADFKNNLDIKNAGTIHTQTAFFQYANKPFIDVEFLPSTLVLNDSIWRINNNHLKYNVADTALQVDNFILSSSNNLIKANGVASPHVEDALRIDLKDIVLDYILSYTLLDPNTITFGGDVTGWATAYGLFGQFAFDADVEMDHATLNGGYLGDAYATASWNREKKTIDILGQVLEKKDTVAVITGQVTPAEKSWGIDIAADSVNLQFIHGWTKSIFSEISGRGFGNIQVFGKDRKTWVRGKALAQNGCLGLGMLGTKYTFTDSVTLDVDAIRFNGITAYDKEDNKLYIDGAVTHDSLFKDIKYNINLLCHNTLVMDLPAKPQDIFYGKVYATGEAKIRGDERVCNIEASAQTETNTDFYLSVATATNATDNSFITFIDYATKDTLTQKALQAKKQAETATPPETNVILNLHIDATPAAAMTVIIDPKTGDRLEGRGAGHIDLMYDLGADNMSIYGDYTLNSGNFYFTLQNIIRKEFKIRDGSRVSFNGDPNNLQVDAYAAYSTTASLKDLFGTEFEQLSTNRSSVPVDCILHLTDQLLNPTISFAIELPQSDEGVESQVRSMISTEDMMMRQILYLLVFNRFYTPDYLKSAESVVGLNESFSLISSTVTSQINNWLSKMTDAFTIGFNMRADGLGAEGSQEYETQFQYQPNERLLINGNFGYRYNDISNQPFFGNLDVEYILTPSGHWRAKAYTHTVDKYSLREANTVQGVGFMFKYDFGGQDKKKKEKKSKQDDAAIVDEKKDTKEIETNNNEQNVSQDL